MRAALASSAIVALTLVAVSGCRGSGPSGWTWGRKNSGRSTDVAMPNPELPSAGAMPNAVQNVGPGGPENGGYNYDYNAQPQDGPNYDSASGGAYQARRPARQRPEARIQRRQPAESCRRPAPTTKTTDKPRRHGLWRERAAPGYPAAAHSIRRLAQVRPTTVRHTRPPMRRPAAYRPQAEVTAPEPARIRTLHPMAAPTPESIRRLARYPSADAGYPATSGDPAQAEQAAADQYSAATGQQPGNSAVPAAGDPTSPATQAINPATPGIRPPARLRISRLPSPT